MSLTGDFTYSKAHVRLYHEQLLVKFRRPKLRRGSSPVLGADGHLAHARSTPPPRVTGPLGVTNPSALWRAFESTLPARRRPPLRGRSPLLPPPPPRSLSRLIALFALPRLPSPSPSLSFPSASLRPHYRWQTRRQRTGSLGGAGLLEEFQSPRDIHSS